MPANNNDSEMQELDAIVRPLVANGFEWRGGDTFGQEVVSIYMNDKLDEFVMLRYNRAPDDTGRAQPPLIHRGAMAELDQPMDNMDSLRFMTIPEFLGFVQPRDVTPVAIPVTTISARAANVFRPS
ncbi:MAG TPA: hypothetical protein VEF76_13900 [Patescibacteria group bacterium]|nr:hypothetical protein [Patescibacteria group bacterium]